MVVSFVKRISVACFLCGSALAAAAAQDPPPPPLDIEAASTDFDYRNNTLLFHQVRITRGPITIVADEAVGTDLNFDDSHWTFSGQVLITTDSGELRAARAEVDFDDNRIARATVHGSAGAGPATFQQALEDPPTLARGEAGTIEYDVTAATVRLQRDAWLSDGRNDIRGQTLVYSIREQRVMANPQQQGDERVRITINPDTAKKNNPPP